jgi:transcriptional regulator with XRE-family HTH domain
MFLYMVKYIRGDIMNIQLGDKIKQLRSARRITQSDLASMIGVTPSAVSSYETIERQPSYDVLIKLAACFNVSTDYLLGFNKKEVIDSSDLIDISNLTKKQKTIIRQTVLEFSNKS